MREAHNADLLALLERFSGARVAVLGDLVADEFLYGETDRISREAPVLIVRYETSELKPGCAANAIANLCALGAEVMPIGVVGDDPTGVTLRQLLRDAGADVAGVLTAEGKPTASKLRVLAGGRNTRRQQMIRVDREGPGAPAPQLLAKLLKALHRAVGMADALLVSDYGLGLLARPLVEAACGLAQAGKIVCVDARYGVSQYRGVTVAKPNEVELEQAVGHAIGENPLAVESAGRELLRTLRSRSLLVTRGRSGMALLRPGAATALLPVHGSADAVDVTGAGDTVMAANTLALACGADPVQAARIANVAGALVVQKPGTATVAVEELRREISAGPVAQATFLQRPVRAVRGRR